MGGKIITYINGVLIEFNMRQILISLLLLLLIPGTFATSINLLAATEESNIGNVIEATLETSQGTGKVFIENNLISNPDTQVSIKIANEVVCKNYFNCENVDFYYTINSGSTIITGPSGGAGLALLTYSHLVNRDISNEYAISGTINSGGYIGNVGGLKEKIRAASNRNIENVLIPFANEKFIDLDKINLTNSSLNSSNLPKIDLVEFGKELGVNVIPVATFDEVLYEVLDVPLKNYTIEQPEFYTEIMAKISQDICTNTNNLIKSSNQNLTVNYSSNYCFESNCTKPFMANEAYNSYTNSTFYYNSAKDLLNFSELSFNQGDYYSSASYCFGANINLRYLEFLKEGLNKSMVLANNSLEDAKKILQTDFNYLNDVQIYSVVKERILDAKDSFSEGINLAKQNKTLEAIDKLSYSYERAQTAIAWSNFYDVPKSKRITGSLENACSLALRDASSRIQYLKFYLDIPLESENALDKARASQNENDYAMCIYYSLESKAEAEIVSSIFGADQKQLEKVLAVKEQIAKKFIAKQYAEGNYPILGYSYLEYGASLKESNPYSSLLYFQMAQELSNLDIFLETDSQIDLIYAKEVSPVEYLLMGIAIGLFLSALVIKIHSSKKKISNKK